MNMERESATMSEDTGIEKIEFQERKDADSLPKEIPKRQPGIRALIGICLAVSLGASLATIAGYDRWYAQKVVAVDIKGYIAQQRDNYLAGKLNDEELRKSFDRLEAVITSIPKNRVIIMGDAVVRNAETVKP